MNTPEHVLMIIRQRLDLDEKDTSKDAEINAMTPIEKFRHIVGWELGDERFADVFACKTVKSG